MVRDRLRRVADLDEHDGVVHDGGPGHEPASDRGFGCGDSWVAEDERDA